LSAIAITGAAGFVGRRLTALLHERGEEVLAIARGPQPEGWPAGSTWLRADLLQPERYEEALKGADCVIHLAALTGKARPKALWRDNVEATEALVGAAARAGVGRLVLVSSIAASFKDRRYYPYAESKIAAEAAALASGVPTVIVRPTMILGAGSPVEANLGKLAGAPIIPMFGDGKRLVQPVDVEAVALLLAGLARDPEGASEIIEFGGPETLTMKDLLARLRDTSGKVGAAKFLHLPLSLIRHSLALVEGPLFALVPFTAGQLASFANDSVAAPHPIAARLAPQRAAGAA
jgi:NADH dehydrogenase